jgi:universal stress protein A
MFAPKTILVPTDFSEYSDKALEIAVDIAKKENAAIEFIHIIAVIQTCAVDYCFDQQTLDQLEENSANASKEQMAKQIDRIPGAKSISITTVIRKGVPYEEIVKEQIEKKIDLIVIASHGMTGLLHYLIGSVAEKVMKGAKCPVLLVRK